MLIHSREEHVNYSREAWKSHWCQGANDLLSVDSTLNTNQLRQIWYMCRGPSYSPELSR